jgi:hypothetical protein
MGHHTQQGRTEDELGWFKRRQFLQAAAAWTALGGYGAALAQGRSNIVRVEGDAMVNGTRLLPGQIIQVGDTVATGPKSSMVVVLGNSSILVRQNTKLSTERGSTPDAVGVLRLVTGAVASVWGRGSERKVLTPTVTAGIRGTGVYTEVLPEKDGREYFCTCYGTVNLSVGASTKLSQAEYHDAFWVDPSAPAGAALRRAPAVNHTDEELEFLAQLVGQRTAWQISGRKGNGSHSGY